MKEIQMQVTLRYNLCVKIVNIGYNAFDSTPTTYILTPSFEGNDYKSFNYQVKTSRSKPLNDPSHGNYSKS